MLALHGRVLALPPATADPAPGHAVFYAPLSVISLLDGSGDTTRVRAAGVMRLGGDTSGPPFVVTDWDDGTRTTFTFPDSLPSLLAVSATPHPLARFHDRLLARPLARPIADLPAGGRFERYAGQAGGGVVRLPQAWTPVAVPASPLWRSLGDHIAVTRDDGSTALLHWRDLETALHLRKDEG
ncbi:MAG: hypothetical protein OXI10_12400 [Gammaproteobacteria bacterium]|nr:hypothetical protein [Gammaproteobacteria bacterium]